jgi:hypothetical protein
MICFPLNFFEYTYVKRVDFAIINSVLKVGKDRLGKTC